MTSWSNAQLESHKETARILDRILAEAFSLICNKKTDEFEVQQFILEKFTQNNLISDSEPPIVAFGINTQHVHYFPSKANAALLKENDLIMIDIWARENKKDMPFADITAMGFYGNKPSAKQLEIFDLVKKAQASAIELIRNKLSRKMMPTCAEIDLAVVETFRAKELQGNFLHTTGHILGFDQAHGDRAGALSQKTQTN